MKISIATEDILTEEVMVKILSSVSDVDIPFKLGKKGCGYLKKNIHKFNELSYRHNVLVVFDSDLQTNINEFRSSIEKEIKNKSRSLDIIIPVREIESWILADREGLSAFLNISGDKLCRSPDDLLDPKEKIISLAKLSKNADIRKGIPPKKGAASKVGLSYNTLLTRFVQENWDIDRAKVHSPSLRTALMTINRIVSQVDS